MDRKKHGQSTVNRAAYQSDSAHAHARSYGVSLGNSRITRLYQCAFMPYGSDVISHHKRTPLRKQEGARGH